MTGAGWRWADLVREHGRTKVEKAIARGELERVGRGRYVVKGLSAPLKVAARINGIVSMRSAAAYHGWEQKRVPRLPDVTVPRNRRINPRQRAFLVPHWSDLPDTDVVDGVTTTTRTLVDCMRMLPLDESLPIVESALRNGDISSRNLQFLADSMRGRGRARARALAAAASARTANAYESVLHAMVLAVPGLNAEPQVTLRLPDGGRARPDFVDLELGIVIEAESFAWHGEADALTRDCERYNAFVAMGLTVIRFSWQQVMLRPAYVLEVLSAAVQIARAHANVA